MPWGINGSGKNKRQSASSQHIPGFRISERRPAAAVPATDPIRWHVANLYRSWPTASWRKSPLENRVYETLMHTVFRRDIT